MPNWQHDKQELVRYMAFVRQHWIIFAAFAAAIVFVLVARWMM
jgi:hypothetical protein